MFIRGGMVSLSVALWAGCVFACVLGLGGAPWSAVHFGRGGACMLLYCLLIT